MTPWIEPIRIEKTSDIPVYLQIVNAVILGIRRGMIRRSVKLPGARTLAKALHIHRKTLQTAYDELMAQGWVTITPRKGAFVVDALPEIKPVRISSVDEVIRYPDRPVFGISENLCALFPASSQQDSKNLTFDDGFPDVRLAPIDLLMREYRSIARKDVFKKYFQYGEPGGAPLLRETLADFLNETRGLPISWENILITRGAQMGFQLAAMMLVRHGDTVVVGEPGFYTATATFRYSGAVIHTVPVDEFGIDVDKIESLCRKKRIAMVYVIPHHHFPTTVTLTPERRIRLLDLATKHNFAIIEDDYDFDFDYNSSPVLPMASLDHQGCVLYIGTLTKTFAPAVRIGFLVAPREFIASAGQLRRLIDWQGDTMMELAVAELYKNGTMARHIRKAVNVYRERRDHLCSLLKEKLGRHLAFKIPDGGMSVWTSFLDANLKEVTRKAYTKGLTLSDSRFYTSGNIDYNAIRLGFASLNLREQERAVEILSKCVR